jgi:putative peptidoglycan lipid II flippase
MITVGGLSLLVKVFGAAKEMVVAYRFGTADALDAFFIAFLLPSFAINVIAGSFNAALVPTFIQVRENKGMEEAQRLLSNILGLGLALLVAISIVFALTAPTILPILGSGFSHEKLIFTRSLFFMLIPLLVINGFSSVWASIINAGERFALAALSPIGTPILVMAALLVMGETWGIYALSLGTVAGFVAEAGLLAWGLKRLGFSPVPHWYGMEENTKQVFRQYMPLVIGAFLMSSTTLVDQSMAAMLGPGSVSALNYGNRVVAFVLGIGSIAVGTAVFPFFSRMVAIDNWGDVKGSLKAYGRLILFITIPLTLMIVVFSESIVHLLFERGVFTRADTQLVGQIQRLYVLQVPFYTLSILIVRLISSLQANHVLMWGAVINVFLNVILNYLFMQWLGVAGIALSTSVVYSVSFCYLLYRLWGLTKRYI